MPEGYETKLHDWQTSQEESEEKEVKHLAMLLGILFFAGCQSQHVGDIITISDLQVLWLSEHDYDLATKYDVGVTSSSILLKEGSLVRILQVKSKLYKVYVERDTHDEHVKAVTGNLEGMTGYIERK